MDPPAVRAKVMGYLDRHSSDTVKMKMSGFIELYSYAQDDQYIYNAYVKE
jgi:hypothetical protein